MGSLEILDRVGRMSDQGENVELVSKELKELNLKKYLSDPCLIRLSEHVIDLEDCGPISVYVQGDLEKMRDGPVIMTIHDLGSSYHSMVEFTNHIDMDEIKHRCLILHISIFGQSHKAPDLPHAFPVHVQTWTQSHHYPGPVEDQDCCGHG